MGSVASKLLNGLEGDDDREGTLYETIDNVWKPKTGGYAEEEFRGSWAQVALLRKNRKVKIYEEILNKVRLGEGIETMPKVEGSTSFEETSHLTRKEDRIDMRGVEPLTKAELDADATIKNILGNVTRSRAHLIPKDPDCYEFWGMVAELIVGFEEADLKAGSKVYHKSPREMVLEYLIRLRINRLIFGAEHNVIYDTLTKGAVVAVPLMTVKEMANWDYKTGYKVLMICSRPETYCRVGQVNARRKDHMDLATDGEIKRATAALKENTKILADSLVSHWDDYFSKVKANRGDKRQQMLEDFKTTLERETVRVPHYGEDIADVAYCGGVLTTKVPWLYTIDLAKLYTGDYAHYIPDPWLLALKASINWTGHCYNGCKYVGDSMEWRLLPACADDDDDGSFEEVHVGGLTFTKAELREFKEKRAKEREADLLDREIHFIPGEEGDCEEGDYEELGDDVLMNLPIVSYESTASL